MIEIQCTWQLHICRVSTDLMEREQLDLPACCCLYWALLEWHQCLHQCQQLGFLAVSALCLGTLLQDLLLYQMHELLVMLDLQGPSW